MYDVQLRRGFIIAESCWLPQCDWRVGVDEDARLFKFPVEQQNAMVDEVGDQHATFVVESQVTRSLDVVECSQYLAIDIYFNHLHAQSPTNTNGEFVTRML